MSFGSTDSSTTSSRGHICVGGSSSTTMSSGNTDVVLLAVALAFETKVAIEIAVNHYVERGK